jgi:hypothetical protein
VLITPDEYGKRRGVSGRAVRKAIDSGRLVKSLTRNGNRWLIEADIADLEWDRNTAPQKVRSARQINNGKARAKGEDPGEPEAPDVPGAGRGQATYAGAKAAAEGYKAMLLKLDYEERAGKLVDKSTAERGFAAAGMQVRDAVMRTSQQMVGDIASAVGGLNQEQRAAVMQVIDRHHVKALEELVRAAGVS